MSAIIPVSVGCTLNDKSIQSFGFNTMPFGKGIENVKSFPFLRYAYSRIIFPGPLLQKFLDNTVSFCSINNKSDIIPFVIIGCEGTILNKLSVVSFSGYEKFLIFTLSGEFAEDAMACPSGLKAISVKNPLCPLIEPKNLSNGNCHIEICGIPEKPVAKN